MKKIKFSELLKQDNVAIHTPTEKQAKTLLNELDKKGYVWASGIKLTTETYYEHYKENTCYDFYHLNKQAVCFSSLKVYQKYGYTIIEFTDIDFGNDDTLKKANTLRIVYIVSMMVLLVSIEASIMLILYLNNKIFFVLTIALSLILIGIGIVAEQKSEDNYDKCHDEEIKNIKLGYEKELADEKKELNAVRDYSLKLERKIEALRDYKKIYIDKSIKCCGVPSKESLLKDIGDDIKLLTPPTLTEDKGMDIKTIYHNKEKAKAKRQSQIIKFRNGWKMTRKKALEILLGEKCIYVLSARSSGKEECVKAIKTIQKDLEVLEIIKVKQVDIEFIGLCADEERYNRAFVPEDDDRKLTQDEFDKVRSWLKNDK